MSQQKTSKISFDKTFFSSSHLSLSLLGGVATILASLTKILTDLANFD